AALSDWSGGVRDGALLGAGVARAWPRGATDAGAMCGTLNFLLPGGGHPHMKRRDLIMLIGGAAAWPLAARAQQAGRGYRIGVLEMSSAASNAANIDALRKSLRELGYVEGQNLVLDYRSADGRTERFPQLAAELLRLNVDVIVTRGTLAVMAAKNATG